MEALHEAQIDCYNQINKLFNNFKKASKEKLTKFYIETRCEMLENYWKDFQNRHSSLFSIKQGERKNFCYFSENIYDVCMEVYLEMKTRIKEKLCNLEETIQSSSRVQSVDMDHFTQPIVTTKLPAIHLPSFSGDYRDWLSFRDLYKSLVHDNNSITKVNKCQYLKSSLKGEAENLVKQIQVSDTNYDIIWDILNKRYDNKRSIVNAFIGKMFNQRRITSESSKAIRDLLDTTTECLATLKSLNLPTDSWDDLIVYIIIQKLDPESHKLFEQRMESNDKLPTWGELSEFLEFRFRTLEAIKFKDCVHTKPITSVKSFATEVKSQSKCLFCKEDHLIFKCKKFFHLDLALKKDFIQKNHICYNCLRKGHTVKMCLQSTMCRKCGRKHHSLLHGNTVSTTDEQQTLQSHTENTNEVQNIQANTVINTAETVPSKYPVILPTALVRVKSNRGNNIHILRALVDQGS